MKVEIRIDSPAYPDYGWCVLNRRPRPYAPDETILQDRPFGDDIGNGIPFQPWWDNMYKINKLDAMAWWLTWEAEKFNNDQDPEVREIDPTVPINIRCTGDGGNLKAYYKSTQTNTHIQLVAYDYNHPELINPDNDTFAKKPWMISLSTAINEYGRVYRIAGGIEPYYYQVCRVDPLTKKENLWIEKTKVTPLEQKPAVWGVSEVMNFRGGI